MKRKYVEDMYCLRCGSTRVFESSGGGICVSRHCERCKLMWWFGDDDTMYYLLVPAKKGKEIIYEVPDGCIPILGEHSIEKKRQRCKR